MRYLAHSPPLVEIEQIYTIHEERDLDFTVQEAGEVYHVIITWTNGETIAHQRRLAHA